MDTLFDVVVLLRGNREIRRILLSFLPRNEDQIELNGKVYIVIKVMYDLSAYQGGGNLAIPAKVFVRLNIYNDF